MNKKEIEHIIEVCEENIVDSNPPYIDVDVKKFVR